MLAIAALGALVALAACAAHPAEPSQAALADASADIAAGRRLAEIYCARCHAIGTSGDSPHPLAPPFRRLSRDYPVNALEEAFAEGILVGHPSMPEFRLEPEQIEDLLAYIESVQERRAG
jgi:mono/diheme cytochrome c family protein